MLERRRHTRTKTPHGRVWLAGPYRCWCNLIDAGNGGVRIEVHGPLEPRTRATVYRAFGEKLGPGRPGTIVHANGRMAGIRYELEEHVDRRAALRHVTRGISAWISGPIITPASVLDMSSTG